MITSTLPEQYRPVAEVALTLPASSYGVVTWSGARPELMSAPIGLTTIAACQLADAFRGLHGSRTFIVRRSADAVTVHTVDFNQPGNLLGTMPAPAGEPISDSPSAGDRYWVTLINRVLHDTAAQDDHDANLTETMRRVHQLPEGTDHAKVWSTALHEPRDGREYVLAFTQLLSVGDHVTGRLYATHA